VEPGELQLLPMDGALTAQMPWLLLNGLSDAGFTSLIMF
jgi:hypothetical protein